MNTISQTLIRVAQSLRDKRNDPELANEMMRFAAEIEAENFDPSVETPATNPMLANAPEAAQELQPQVSEKFMPTPQNKSVVHTLTIKLMAPEGVSRQQMVNYIDDIEKAIPGVKPVGLEWGVKES